MKPLAVDLCCGVGGWTHGLLAEDWDVVGFDIERHQYGDERYPAQLVLQDIRTIDGRQFRGKVSLIVASPTCTEFSYMAMPWTRGKQIAKALRGDGDFPVGYKGSRTLAELTALVDACFRIAQEAECPIVLENVKCAQPWIGRARWLYGSFALWGDVPALMPMTAVRGKRPGHDWNRFKETGEVSPHWRMNGEDSRPEKVNEAIKNTGGSWFAIGSPGQKDVGRNPVHELAGQKHKDLDGYERTHPKAFGWKSPRTSSGATSARKAASAMIAKIPFTLARHIAAAWKPELERAEWTR